MKTDYIVTLTNASKAQWPYCVKAANEQAAVNAAKARHNNHNKAMPRLTVVNITVDKRPYLRRCKAVAKGIADSWRNGSLAYRYGQCLAAASPLRNITLALLKAKRESMYYQVLERELGFEFAYQLAEKRKR